ncbi:histone-lysine N-methyltransferase SETD1A [Eurytemora carolleeae]|uniref:histone-lysine N-methyltransferase SETD1A n=1 Tax=Eurytemora carolleeae TaxID=1294199 RepID=UPI000C7711D3|nr:histone-lysine N-methyltransferase SETD1A [Eurytemora carolleeae]XP_023344774.1 histone-lysine N-methyltransferase SETD1A [Eurytemora carolleeae]|eukprot:XP_023344773.1 histone-lysine N-methyltransferase SETD1A-like [Eurytemora affinis]
MQQTVQVFLFLGLACSIQAQSGLSGGRSSASTNSVSDRSNPDSVPGRSNPESTKPIRFISDDEARRSSFISSNRSPPPTPRSGFKPAQRDPSPRVSSTLIDEHDDEPLPSGPTRIPDLPSGPTRRPGQPTPRTDVPSIGIPRDVFSSLPLLTTPRPSTETPRSNVNFLLSPPRGQRFRPDPDFTPPSQHGVFVTSDLDILDQTKLFTNMDPNQEQFIKAPLLNAGALPLAFQSNIPLNLYPPFNNQP